MLEALGNAVITLMITFVVLGVVIPVALAVLLWRQVSRSRVGGWLFGQRTPAYRRPTKRGGVAAVQPVLRRQWALLARDAANAGARFTAATASIPTGPLRSALEDARVEVLEAVAEAQRLAVQGDRTERAYRDILSALDSQRRRRRTPAGPEDIQSALAAATRAQHESAERLATAARAQLCQLQLVVARLHGLTAHALELSTLDRTPQLSASSVIADRLAALRLATAEIETVAAV